METPKGTAVQVTPQPRAHKTPSSHHFQSPHGGGRGGRLLYAVFQLSLAQASRGLWFYTVLGAAMVSGGAIAYAAAGIAGLDTANRFRSSLYSLMGLSSYLLPLLGLLVGALDLAGDQETGALHLLAAQPGRRYHIVLGKYLGLGMLLSLATVAMMSLAGIAMALRDVSLAPEILLAFCSLAIALIAVYLGFGLAIGSLSASRLTALVAALAMWVTATFLYDLAVFALLGWGGAGQLSAALALALVLNPLDAFRILTIMLLGNLTALGPSGAALVRMVPEPWGTFILIADLVLWVGGSLGAAVLALAKKDL